jgi:hypothetical protein
VALHAVRPVIAPLIPTVIDAVYGKLMLFSVTATLFVPCHTDYEGETLKLVLELTLKSPQITFRKDFLKTYLVKLVTADYESEQTWEYMDQVRVMHTGIPGFKHREKKPELTVDHIHVRVVLCMYKINGYYDISNGHFSGYVVDILLSAVLGTDLDIATKTAVLKRSCSHPLIYFKLFNIHMAFLTQNWKLQKYTSLLDTTYNNSRTESLYLQHHLTHLQTRSRKLKIEGS